MKILNTRFVVLAPLALGFTLSLAQPITFKVGAGRPSQQIAQVESVTDFETFTGRTEKVVGTVVFDPERRTGSGKLSIEVASLDTGIPLRDEHLRSETWLSAEKHPTITFEAKEVRHVRGDEYRVTGQFTLRGVTKTITVPVTAKHLKESEATRRAGFRGDVLQIKTTFSVKLADYGIIIPGPAQGKVAETVRVSVTAYAQSGV